MVSPQTNIFIFCLIFLWALFPQTTCSQTFQEVHVSGSPNPVGSGARALGMGGAFIGVADDATSASWNPGGLIQLETPEVSCVFSYDRLYEDRSFETNRGASGEYHVNLYDINYLSLAYPFKKFGRNMIISLNYQTRYNFNKRHEYDFIYTYISLGAITISTSGKRLTDYETDGYLKALSPAIAVQITPTFSFGLTLNWHHPDLGSKWETNYFDHFQGLRSYSDAGGILATYSLTKRVRWRDEFEFKTSLNPFGFRDTSYTMGFLWNINTYFTLGCVFKPQFTADVHYEKHMASSREQINLADPSDAIMYHAPWATAADENQEMDMPASYGLGLACRFSDQFTVDLDVYRTEWQHFVLRQESGREISLITGGERRLADTQPTHQVRLGAEYLFLLKHKYVVPLRVGIFYDPEPTEDNPDKFYGFSLGGGIAVSQFVFDMAYQYRWGNDVRKVSLEGEEVYQDVKQHTVYASVILHF